MSSKKWIGLSIVVVALISLINVMMAVDGKRNGWSLLFTAAAVIFWIVYIGMSRKQTGAMVWSMIFWGVSAIMAFIGAILLGSALKDNLVYAFFAMIISSNMYGVRYLISTPTASMLLIGFISLAYSLVSLGFIFKIRRGDYT